MELSYAWEAQVLVRYVTLCKIDGKGVLCFRGLLYIPLCYICIIYHIYSGYIYIYIDIFGYIF